MQQKKKFIYNSKPISVSGLRNHIYFQKRHFNDPPNLYLGVLRYCWFMRIL